MATKTTEQRAKHDEQRGEIIATIERIRSLAEAENLDGVEELYGEALTMIEGIKGAGSVKIRKELTAQLEDAAKAAPALVEKIHEGVVALETQDYTTIPGIDKLISKGAKDLAEGVKLHLKAADTAKATATILLEMRLKMTDRNGAPDLGAKSDAAKQAARAMYEAVSESHDLADTFENRDAVKKLMRSVQYQMSQVVVDYVRELDNNPDEAAKFEKATTAFPDASPSVAVFSFYKINDKSQAEIAAEREAEKRALANGARAAIENGNGDEGEGDEGEGEGTSEPAQVDPDQYAMAVTSKLEKATRDINVRIIEAASDDTKEDMRDHLERQLTALKALIAATL